MRGGLLYRSGQEAEQFLALLGRIEFHARTPPRLDSTWIDAITVAVEAGFGGFGWPNAILVATGQGGGAVPVRRPDG